MRVGVWVMLGVLWAVPSGCSEARNCRDTASCPAGVDAGRGGYGPDDVAEQSSDGVAEVDAPMPVGGSLGVLPVVPASSSGGSTSGDLADVGREGEPSVAAASPAASSAVEPTSLVNPTEGAGQTDGGAGGFTGAGGATGSGGGGRGGGQSGSAGSSAGGAGFSSGGAGGRELGTGGGASGGGGGASAGGAESTSPAVNGTCDIVLNTGCDDGERCALNVEEGPPPTAVAVCEPEGDTPPLGSCTAISSPADIDSCRGGFTCDFLDESCRQACTNSAECGVSNTCLLPAEGTGRQRQVGTCHKLCDVFEQDCSAQETCFWYGDDPTGYCATSLGCGQDQACELQTGCVQGYISMEGLCRQYCDPSGNEVTCDAEHMCLPYSETVGLCFPACDVLEQDCGDEACYPVGATRQGVCLASLATAQAGESCVATVQCAAGTACADEGGGVFACRAFCDPALDACELGLQCQVSDGAEYGLCVPP